MKFSTSVSLINRNTGHKPIHNDMGKIRWTSLIINFDKFSLGFIPYWQSTEQESMGPLRMLCDDLFTCVALHHRGTHAISTVC